MTSISLLGSTGSIGTQTIEVVDRSGGDFTIDVLGAHSSVDLVVQQAEALRPGVVAMADPDAAILVKARLDPSVEVIGGPTALADVSGRGDIVVNGVVGFAGLDVTLGALSAGKRLALANKESLIAAGPVVRPLRDTPGAELIPVDSEHCALHQCLRSSFDAGREVSELVLTASGGPFRGRTKEDLASVTVEQALDHPTWSMGPKITIDSSTLMNKGLEVIEAHELFGVDYDNIAVTVHPTSIVHSMVSFTDGATIAQLSEPDMRLPISYALCYPERFEYSYGAMDFSQRFEMVFEPPDLDTFRCLALAFEAGRKGEPAPAFFSAANEIAVEWFLEGRLRWTQIAEVVEASMDEWDGLVADSVEAVLEADLHARSVAGTIASDMEPT